VSSPPQEAVLVTGASGLMGRSLCARLEQAGALVIRATRDPRQGAQAGVARWDVATGALEVFGPMPQVVIHLAGESLASGRWSRRRKERIWKSRVDATRALCEWSARCEQRPRLFLHASGVGFYGNRPDGLCDEGEPQGGGFLAELAGAWEVATEPLRNAGVRTISIRLGMVLSRDGGALSSMLPAFRWGLGGRVGTGRQGVSWITCRDACRAIQFLMDPGAPIVDGAVNVVSPQPVSQREFAQALGRALHRPAILPAPACVLRLVLGEMANELLLSGQCAVPTKLEGLGFRFLDGELSGALTSVIAGDAN